MFGKLKISISIDMMLATAYVDPVGQEYITEDLFNEKMADLGINAGIDRQAIQRLLLEENIGNKEVIARGKTARPGKDGFFEFSFDTNAGNYTPTVNDDGTVDYSVSRNLVTKGSLIAVYHKAEPGYFGFTVFSTMVAPVPPNDTSKITLINVDALDNKYYAKTDGEVVYKNGVLEVKNTLVINGDASIATGEIEYKGEVHVKGSVLTGAVIKTSGNVTVSGTVEGATIKSGGNITVRKGIQGSNSALIQADGDVTAAFIEEATVIAGKTVRCNYAYCSNITSDGEVIAEGRHGVILGGTTKSANLIRTKYVGNEESGVKTKLIIDPDRTDANTDGAIIIEKQSYYGCQIYFGEENYLKYEGGSGEFHCIRGNINKFGIGEYVPLPEYSIEETVVKKKILLVDDEPIILKTYFRFLKEEYDVRAVTSAKEALQLMETVLPDLVLLDYNMPVMDGAQLLQEMRSRSWKIYHNVPVIFVTAAADKEVIRKCLSLYPQGYLIKPIGEDALKNSVREFFINQEHDQSTDEGLDLELDLD